MLSFTVIFSLILTTFTSHRRPPNVIKNRGSTSILSPSLFPVVETLYSWFCCFWDIIIHPTNGFVFCSVSLPPSLLYGSPEFFWALRLPLSVLMVYSRSMVTRSGHPRTLYTPFDIYIYISMGWLSTGYSCPRVISSMVDIVLLPDSLEVWLAALTINSSGHIVSLSSSLSSDISYAINLPSRVYHHQLCQYSPRPTTPCMLSHFQHFSAFLPFRILYLTCASTCLLHSRPCFNLPLTHPPTTYLAPGAQRCNKRKTLDIKKENYSRKQIDKIVIREECYIFISTSGALGRIVATASSGYYPTQSLWSFPPFFLAGIRVFILVCFLDFGTLVYAFVTPFILSHFLPTQQ